MTSTAKWHDQYKKPETELCELAYHFNLIQCSIIWLGCGLDDHLHIVHLTAENTDIIITILIHSTLQLKTHTSPSSPWIIYHYYYYYVHNVQSHNCKHTHTHTHTNTRTQTHTNTHIHTHKHTLQHDWKQLETKFNISRYTYIFCISVCVFSANTANLFWLLVSTSVFQKPTYFT